MNKETNKEFGIKTGRITKASTSDNANKKMTRDEVQAKLKQMRDKDNELVIGVFTNHENRAGNTSKGALVFGYKMYKGDKFEFYELHDGERYQLPRGVVRHLNQNCFYREYQQLDDSALSSGTPGSSIRTGNASDGRLQKQNYQQSRKIHRFAFHSLEYMEDEGDIGRSNLVEVTLAP